MINIEKFIRIRKRQKISQKKLADGICTQATLSNFESGIKIPSFKILNQLCQRLGIELGDIVINSSQTKVGRNLNEAEYAYLRFDYSEIFDLLTELNEAEIKHPYDRIHFNYLKGIYALENERDQVTGLFYFNSILNEDWLKKDNIYYLLALKGCAEVYEARRDFAKAKEFYDQIAKTITKIKVEDNVTSIQILSILYRAGDFYGRHNEHKESSYLLRYAYQIGSQFHEVYYMGRILYRLGQNDLLKGTTKMARQHLHDARAFARFNHDQYILTKAKKSLDQIDES